MLFLASAEAYAQAPDAAPPSLGDNAALKYWQAFAQLPQWTEQQQRIIGDWRTVPLDADTQAVLESSRGALLYLDRGAKLKACDWGLDLSDGPGLVLPHLSKARELARLAGLRVRQELASGKQTAAVDDLGAGFALARHVGVENLLISVMVQAAIEGTFVELAAQHLTELDAAALAQLEKQLADLPAGGTVKQAMRLERDHAGDWFRGSSEPRGPKPEGVAGALRSLGGVAATAHLVRFSQAYEDAAKLADLPPEEQRKEFERLGRKYAHSPLPQLSLPAYEKAFDAEHKAKARLAMLKAALAMRQGGREKLATVPDPYGMGEFTYRERPQGFELESKLTVAGKPMTLVVGPPDAAPAAGEAGH